MDSLLKILLVACVCYSTVDAGRASGPPPDSAQQAIERERYQCANAWYATCMRPVYDELHNSKREIVSKRDFATQLGKRGIKEVCRLALQFESCTIDNQCSAAVRAYAMTLFRRHIKAFQNLRQYACIQHIEDIGELLQCINQKEQQGVYIDDVVYSRCPAFVHSLGFFPFCSVGDHLDCVTDAIMSHCGQTAADALHGLIDGVLSDLGCCISSEASGGNERTLELLRQAFD